MNARSRLLQLPSAGLGTWPTPLQRLDRFSEDVGTEIWIKRDDIQGVALAGNKIRKFDVVLGQAVADGYDTLVTTGARQSNSARTGAAAAAALGLACVLVLSGDQPAQATANLLLDHLLGAEVRFAGDVSWSELNQLVDQVVAERNAAGARAFAAPVGCSSPLGSLGFARAFDEIDQQLTHVGLQPEAIVHASTSGGTHAGLLVGRQVCERSVRLVAVDAGRISNRPARTLVTMARASADLIDLELDLDEASVEVIEDQLGPGYAIPTEAGNDAIRRLARTEAILVDPVYSAKGLAGLIAMVERGEVSGPVVFWHTGGYHALFDPDLVVSPSERC